jgi:hypothetical protein
MSRHKSGHRLQFRHIIVENVKNYPNKAANLP